MERKINILLIEDDSLQAEDTAAHLERNFGGSVEVLSTESDFVGQISRITANPPDVFVIDINLPWTDPYPEMPLPPQRTHQEGKEFAGLRCCELLSECDETRRIPVVLYSIFDRSHYEHRLRKLPEWVIYTPKDNLPLLCETIRKLMRLYPSQEKPEP